MLQKVKYLTKSSFLKDFSMHVNFYCEIDNALEVMARFLRYVLDGVNFSEVMY